MTKETLYCTVLDNVYEAAVKMKDGDVGAIPVVLDDGLELVGIVTDRDLVLRGIAAKTEFAKITNVMTTDLITVSEDDSIEKRSISWEIIRSEGSRLHGEKRLPASLRSAMFQLTINRTARLATR